MKLTEQEKQKMRDCRYDDNDIEQVQMAASRYCKYSDENGNRLTAKQVIEMLGRETWFSGIVRAAFHWTCGRGDEGKNYVSFDCSSLFK